REDTEEDMNSPLPDDDFVRYLQDRIKQLEVKNDTIMKLNYQMENENRMSERIKLKQEQEIRHLKSEIARLKTPPLLVGQVEDVLDDGRAIVRITNGNTFSVTVGSDISILVGDRVAMNQQTLSVVEVLPPPYSVRIKVAEVIGDTNVDFSMIGGLDEQIAELREVVELPLVNAELFEKVGILPPQGVMLYGPPGNGKTLLAKAVAHSTNAKFIHIVGSELVQKYIGEGARLVRELFEIAREDAPSIIFIDELDAIGSKRYDSTSGDREVQRTLMQLLAELDGFDPRGNVKVIAATNRPDILDPALLRPGRFDRLIDVPLPDEEGRFEILRIHTKDMNINEDVDLRKLSSMTTGFNGAELRMLAVEAGMFAIRERRDTISMADFIKSLEKIKNTDSQTGQIGDMFV
ncbi:MAG: proteasome-activating nucleotidase, partial [Methermicoccaceae archaeon]